MFDRFRLAWNALSLYEEVKTMNMAALIRVLISFAMGFVATAGACYLSGMGGSLTHCLTTGGTAGLTTSWAFLKQSPVAPEGPPA